MSNLLATPSLWQDGNANTPPLAWDGTKYHYATGEFVHLITLGAAGAGSVTSGVLTGWLQTDPPAGSVLVFRVAGTIVLSIPMDVFDNSGPFAAVPFSVATVGAFVTVDLEQADGTEQMVGNGDDLSYLDMTPDVPACVQVAVDDTTTLTAIGPAFADVRSNDTPCADNTLTLVGTLPPELSFNTTTGAVALLTGAAAGVYTFDYQLGVAGPTATVTVTYDPPDPPPPPPPCEPFVPVCACPT